MKQLCLTSLALAMALSCASSQAADLIKDDFNDGTSNNWSKGEFASIPATVKTDTDGNKYLSIKTVKERSGSEPDTKMVVDSNPGPWQGNYNAKGVKSVSARFKNLSKVPLEMHVALQTSVGEMAARSVVTKGVIIPADQQWHPVRFSLDDAGMEPVDKYGHGGSNFQMMSPTQIKNHVTQIRFSQGKLDEKTDTGHGTPEGGQIYRGWNDGPDLPDAELAVDDIALSTDAGTTGHDHGHGH